MTELIRMAKALSDPARVRILSALLNRELCVCELSDALGMAQSTLSTHLQVIRKAELVAARRVGKWMYYAMRGSVRRKLTAIFRAHGASLRKGVVLQADKARLRRRLQLRENGTCCVGFSRKSLKKGHPLKLESPRFK